MPTCKETFHIFNCHSESVCNFTFTSNISLIYYKDKATPHTSSTTAVIVISGYTNYVLLSTVNMKKSISYSSNLLVKYILFSKNHILLYRLYN